MMLHEPLCDRINRGFYRFGETILELNIINHKLMARTEAGRLCGVQERQRDSLVGCLASDEKRQDGWNRSKFGPIEKFLMYYEKY